VNVIRRKFSTAILLALTLSAPVYAATVYETREEFVNRAFNGSPPGASLLWLSGDRKAAVRQLLGHDYPALRLRYWCQDERSAWILDEIGKELPITVGVVIDHGRIRSLRVLVYRENRGGEVSTPSFTDQFDGATLGDAVELDRHIDGITGATLSVNALTRLATVALFLQRKTDCDDGP
jgi:hypothetical protein